MIPLEKLRALSKLFLVSGILLVPISIIELYYGELYNSSILLADSFHGFIDATSAVLFSVLLSIVYKKSSKFPWGLYNLESIAILFATLFIVYLALDYLTTEINDINVSQPAWLSVIVYVVAVIFVIIYAIERKYSWIELVKSDLAHIKLDVSMEILSGIAIIISNYYLTLTVIVAMITFIIIDAARQFKEAIYSLVGVNYDSPIKDRMKAILTSLGYDVKNIYVRKIGSFYTLYVIIGLDPSITLKEIYKIRKTIKRIGSTFDSVVSIDVRVVPSKSKKQRLISSINELKAFISNKADEKDRPKYPSIIKNITSTRTNIRDSTSEH